MPANLNGIVINEILADPVRSVRPRRGFDTDGNGVVNQRDEFVELFNTGGSPVDISDWTLGDDDGNTFTFPAGTVVNPGTGVVLVTNYNGQLPPGFFDFNQNGQVWNNRGDLVILRDTQGNEINAGYPDSRGGRSIQRSPDGSDNLIIATPTPECFLKRKS